MKLFSPTVRLSDAIEGLGTLDTGSVALVLSDLPSGQTRAPTDRAPDFDRLWPEVWRVLQADGIVVFMASCMRFAVDTIISQPKSFRYDLVWEKSRATGFFEASRQPLRSHEHILVFYQRPGVFRPQMSKGHPPINTARRKQDIGHGHNYGPATRSGHESRAGATDRFPRSVIHTSVVPNIGDVREHHQEKPQPLLRWLVSSYTNPGDLIVDPYAGSGSTGEAAVSLGRLFAGFDDDPRYGR